MTPDGATVDLYQVIENLRIINTLLYGIVLALVVALWWLEHLRDAGCVHCTHCQGVNNAKNRTASAAAAASRERLFGRQVTPSEGEQGPPREDGAHGNPEHDEGREGDER